MQQTQISTAPVRALLASPYALERESIARSVEGLDWIRFVAHAAHTNDVIQKVSNSNIDLILFDVDMPGLNVIAMTRFIKRRASHIKVVVLGDKFYEDQVVGGVMQKPAGSY